MRKRGGSYNNNPRNCRSAYRNNNNAPDNNNGFRVVCVPPSTLLFQSLSMGIGRECTEESRPVPVAISPKINQIGEPSRVKPNRFPIYSFLSGEMAAKFNIVTHEQQVQYFVEDLNGVPLDMILIPSGSFIMGSPELEKDSLDRERPQHRVTVPIFFMGRYPITQAQWKAVAAMPQVEKKLEDDPSYDKGDKRPVENISWQDAIEFCARLSVYTKRNYRLPSEAEWEYACRAGTTDPFHFGETISTDLANYRGSDDDYGAYGRGEKGVYRGETTDVDSFGVANDFGLSEMHGNVWEWCLDPWHGNYNGSPNDGSVWDDENQQEDYYDNIVKNIKQLLTDKRSHVLRGGSYDYLPRTCRSAFRSGDYAPVSYGGFRVVCVPPRSS